MTPPQKLNPPGPNMQVEVNDSSKLKVEQS